MRLRNNAFKANVQRLQRYHLTYYLSHMESSTSMHYKDDVLQHEGKDKSTNHVNEGESFDSTLSIREEETDKVAKTNVSKSKSEK